MLKTQLVRNYGHPWDTKRKGFDVLFVYSDNYKEVSDYSIAAQKKFWASWMIGNVKNVDGVFVGVCPAHGAADLGGGCILTNLSPDGSV